MPEDFPDMRDGDEIQPYLFNIIYAELRRWRKARGDGLVNLAYADSASNPPLLSYGRSVPLWIQLTGAATSGGYPWQEVQIVPGSAPGLSGVTGPVSGTGNDPAYELAGCTGLGPDGTVYLARRSSSSGALIFDASGKKFWAVVPSGGIGSGTYATPANATGATLLKPNASTPGFTSTGTTFTLYNTFGHALTGGTQVLCTPKGQYMYIEEADC